MDLPSIVESLLIASESALPTSEIARLVRARASEFSEDSITEADDETPLPEGPEAELDFEALSQITDEEVLAAIKELNDHYEESGRSFILAERSKGWKIHTRSDFAGFIKLLFPGRKPERLSPPAMETLAIIAYRQPVTKAALEAVRGVSCDGMLQKLLDRELVKIEGRAELPGRPLLYATTELFLEHFGITKLDDLPNIGELRKVELPDGTEEEVPEAGESDKPEENPEPVDEEPVATQLGLNEAEKPAESEEEDSAES